MHYFLYKFSLFVQCTSKTVKILVIARFLLGSWGCTSPQLWSWHNISVPLKDAQLVISVYFCNYASGRCRREWVFNLFQLTVMSRRMADLSAADNGLVFFEDVWFVLWYVSCICISLYRFTKLKYHISKSFL